jgi:CheY-like chemotaxis protein
MKTSTAVPAPRRAISPLTIAFADDVPEIRQLAREWLTHAGHTVVCAENGRELTQLWRERHFDLVITDVMMPESDGFEVIAELKKLHRGIRVIAISGGGTVMPTQDCLRVAHRLGADAVLAKPFTRLQLIAAIAAAAPQD